MTLKHLLTASAAALILASCGNKAEKKSELTAEEGIEAAYGEMEKLADKAKDVKIKDKKGLTKSQRYANTYITGMDKIADALESVDDQSSAEKAAKIIRDVTAEFEEIADKNDMSQAGMTAAMMSRMTELAAVQQRMAGSMMRISQKDPELMKMLSEEMSKLDRK